ncbi:MAG: hypothetical protein PHC92_12000 [Syntrophomonadaceae bacterium]|nr:hypothetical protein [Syntrophomonadaceae bacterium]
MGKSKRIKNNRIENKLDKDKLSGSKLDKYKNTLKIFWKVWLAGSIILLLIVIYQIYL